MSITKSRKTLRLLGAGIVALALPVFASSHASAGASGWELVGSTFFSEGSDSYSTYYVHSNGGNFKACVRPEPNGKKYWLKEYDVGISNKDELVGERNPTDNCMVFKKIGRFVDGKNKQAEFYMETKDSKAEKALFYD
jgi:hypothetical protein